MVWILIVQRSSTVRRCGLVGEEAVHGFKAFIVMVESGDEWNHTPLSQGRPEVKHLLQGGVSGKESLLAKPLHSLLAKPLHTSLKWRSVLRLCDHRSCPLPVVGRGGGLRCCPYVTESHPGIRRLSGEMPTVPLGSLGLDQADLEVVCLCLLSAGIKGLQYYACHKIVTFKE